MVGFPIPFEFQALSLPEPVLDVGEWFYTMTGGIVDMTFFFTGDMDTTRIPETSSMEIKANGFPIGPTTYDWIGSRELHGVITDEFPKPETPLTCNRASRIGNLFGVEGGPAGLWPDTVLEDVS